MIIVAMMLALSAAFGIWRYLHHTEEVVKELTATRPVVVAAKQIKAGAKITSEDLTIKQMPRQSVPREYPDSVEPLIGRIVKGTIQPDEAVTDVRLVAKGTAGGLSVLIPEGQRAVTIKVTEVSGIGGFINPGDRVDILSVYKKRDIETKEGESQEGEAYSKTILQNVLVLAVGDKLYDPDNLVITTPNAATHVTVALNPKDSEKLSLAVSKSQVQLTLRSHGEEKITVASGVGLEEVYDFLSPPPSKSFVGELTATTGVQSGSNISESNTIEIISGDERSFYSY